MTKSFAVAAAENAFSPLKSSDLNGFSKMAPKAASNSKAEFIMPVPADAPELKLAHYKHGEPTSHWVYQDKDGNPCFYVCRKDMEDGSKTFWPVALVKGKLGQPMWRCQMPTGTRPLLNLPEVLASDSVLIVEGEKAFDAAKVLFPQMAVTTFSGGSNSFEKSDYSVLHGKTVTLSPDNDACGLKAMETIAEKAYEAGAVSVSMLHPSSFEVDLPKGADLADIKDFGYTPDQCASILKNHAQPVKAPVHWEPDDLSFPYFLDEDGVYYRQVNRKGEGYVTKLCSPLSVKAHIRDHENGNWGYVINVTDRDGQDHEVILYAYQFVGKNNDALERLVTKGLVIQNFSGSEKHVMAYIQQFPTEARGRTADRIGWNDDKYITPSKVYGGTEKEQLFFQDSQPNKTSFKMAGSLSDWQNHIAKYGEGNSRYILALCAGFAASLLPLIKGENTAFHFVGNSSIGKSTLLNVACSIYGSNKHVWRATDNALETLFASHNNVLLCMDELGQLDKQAAKHIAYLIGNGMGKSRMSQNATAKKVYEWLLILLSSGEKSLQDLMNEEGKGRKQTAGEGVRFIEILANAGYGFGIFADIYQFPTGKEMSEHLNNSAATYYGTAGDAWLNYLTANIDEVTETAYDLIRQFENSLNLGDADGQVKRVAVRFANVAAAGELAIQAGILPWPQGEAFRGVKECFDAWLNQRGSKQSTEVIQGMENLEVNLEKYASRNFEYWDTDYGHNLTTANKHEVWGWKKKNSTDDWEFYVTEEGFKSLTGGYHSQSLKEALVNGGLMALTDKGEFKKQYRVPSNGTKRLYLLTPNNIVG